MVRRWLVRVVWVWCVWSCGVAPVVAGEERLASPLRIPGRSIDAAVVPGNATIITAEEIRSSGASTLPELLAREEGVTLLDTQGFGLGSDSTLNLRGVVNGSRSNVLVLVDGVRQNRFTGDEVHWASIPLEQVERIEILRGGGGTIYGEGALAGVINISTKHSAERLLETETGVEMGTFGWRTYSLATHGRAHPFRYGVNATRHFVDGYREFSSSRNTTVTAHGGLELLPQTQMELNVLHSDDTTAFPGGLTPKESQDRNRQAVMSRVGIFEDQSEQVSLDLVLGPYDGLTWLVNTFWRARDADSLRSGLYTLTPSRGLNLRSSHEWTGAHLANVVTSGFELVDDKAATGTRGGARTDESNREGYGFYLEDTLTLGERLSVVGGFRYDRSHFEEDIVAFDSDFNEVNYVGTLQFEGKSPKLGVTYQVVPERLQLFGSYSRPFKAPNVDDFASRSPEFQGNISLQPQQADAYELGTRARLGPWDLKATGFYTRIDEEILFVQGIPGNPFIFQNQNHDTRRFGLESGARFELPERGLRGYLTYTFVDAEFRKGEFRGRTIPGTAEHTLTAGLGVSPLPALWINLDWLLVSDAVRINDVSNALPEADNYGVLNLSLHYDVLRPLAGPDAPRAKIFLAIKNLTNERYGTFQSSNGHTLATGAGENPMPPINVVGGVTLQF